MKIDRAFIDTNIPMYAAGKGHPLKRTCINVLHAVAEGKIRACTDAEVFQEILHRFLFVNDTTTGFRIFDNFNALMKGWVLSITVDDAHKARHLAEKYPRARARDLLHVAVMINHDVKDIISTDAHFEKFQEVRRIRPEKYKDFM